MPGYPFSLNNAVDALLKKEFEIYRKRQSSHPLFERFGLRGIIPWSSPKLEEYRDALRRGITYKHPEYPFRVFWGLDDIWFNQETGELIVADYKAASKKGELTIDADWQMSYKRQISLYCYLVSKTESLPVSKTAYFVYCNGLTEGKSADRFGAKLHFEIELLPYEVQLSWIEPTLKSIHLCLQSDSLPEASPHCDWCAYVAARGSVHKLA